MGDQSPGRLLDLNFKKKKNENYCGLDFSFNYHSSKVQRKKEKVVNCLGYTTQEKDGRCARVLLAGTCGRGSSGAGRGKRPPSAGSYVVGKKMASSLNAYKKKQNKKKSFFLLLRDLVLLPTADVFFFFISPARFFFHEKKETISLQQQFEKE